MNPLVDYSKVYSTLNDMTDYADLGDADKFFYDPMSPEGQQFQQMKNQQAQQAEQQNMQMQAAAD